MMAISSHGSVWPEQTNFASFSSAIFSSLRIDGPYSDKTAVGTWMNSGWPGFTRSPEIKTRSFSSYKEMLHGEWPGVS